MGIGKRLLRLQETSSKTGLPSRSIYHEIQAGRFPAPVKIGPRASAWLESEVDQWIADRISERDTGRPAQ
jgi:prophage regulatory protein